MTGRTFLFMPESAYGPTNNCVGIASVLRGRGHRVVFAAEASWRGKLTALGFEEDLVDLAPPSPQAERSEQAPPSPQAERSEQAPPSPQAERSEQAPPSPQAERSEQAGRSPQAERSEQGGAASLQERAEADPGQYWKDFVRDTAPEFRKPTIEQLETVIKPIWDGLIDGVKFCEPQLKAIIERARPDVIVEDNVVGFPALVTAGVPYVRIVSCNPLEAKGAGVPPPFSGYPAADQGRWESFRAEYDRVHRGIWADFGDWWTRQGAAPLPDLEFIPEGNLNLYVYPQEADYAVARPLGPSWHRLDSSVRETEEEFELPESLAGRSGALIYLSLGSLGSADVELMRRLVAILAGTPYRYIVSKGPLHAEIDLPDNMWGAEFVPQTRVIPQADLVITHGGNNTTTEALHFGKPMICLPLFWDQYDNAQRVDELGLGIRLDPYRVSGDELRAATGRLLADAGLRTRLAGLGTRIRARDGVRRAADLIEKA